MYCIIGEVIVPHLFIWMELSLATDEHGLLRVQKGPMKIDGPKGQRVVRSRDKIGLETPSSEEPQNPHRIPASYLKLPRQFRVCAPPN